ncbi:hypothetical protein FB451DRAFT_1053977 [Mycena latifolia]|nr:hypothetical protein FB451DRAFT_1053977 [Mycena latifolia]
MSSSVSASILDEQLCFGLSLVVDPVVPVSDSPAYLKVCPAPTVHFTGREDILQEMTQYFNTGIGRRHIFLLHGLGGSGKSQIAFKFVEESTSLPVSRCAVLDVQLISEPDIPAQVL